MNQHFAVDAAMSLGEAMQTLRASELKGDMTNKMPAEIMQAVEQHDAVHILFNCGTSIQDEIAAHVWMLLATTVNISEVHRAVASLEHRSVLAGIGHLKLIGIWVRCLPRIMGIIVSRLRMNKRLAVEDLPHLKAQSVLKIRQEYGIVV
ncbi:MAG: hypothetical protein HC866_23990 [Leptolyngbyaceae cyanobacterium RU_5_1]|nr:hypothetical protein [Leptolyngbyaceae cyanobacterium RU_5_1]